MRRGWQRWRPIRPVILRKRVRPSTSAGSSGVKRRYTRWRHYVNFWTLLRLRDCNIHLLDITKRLKLISDFSTIAHNQNPHRIRPQIQIGRATCREGQDIEIGEDGMYTGE